MKQPLDHQRSRKKPVRKPVWIAGDTEVADELSELEASLSRVKFQSETIQDETRREAALQQLIELEEKIALKKEEVRSTSIKFLFQGLSPKAYDHLLGEHPPTDEQQRKAKDAGQDAPFNEETLPYALITACCIEPDMEPSDLLEWLTDGSFNQAEIMSLFLTATEVNQTRKIINLGKG
jgi:hypothetical protein